MKISKKLPQRNNKKSQILKMTTLVIMIKNSNAAKRIPKNTREKNKRNINNKIESMTKMAPKNQTILVNKENMIKMNIIKNRRKNTLTNRLVENMMSIEKILTNSVQTRKKTPINMTMTMNENTAVKRRKATMK
jgi:hypothetical protein